MATYIAPLTHGELSITLKDTNDVPITDATVTADVYDCRGTLTATAQAMPHAGSGVYILTILPTWSDGGSGTFLLGEFIAHITATDTGSNQVTKRIRYVVKFDDDD